MPKITKDCKDYMEIKIKMDFMIIILYANYPDSWSATVTKTEKLNKQHGIILLSIIIQKILTCK